MKPCIRALLNQVSFAHKDDLRTARNLIVKDLRAEGVPPDEVKETIVGWAKDVVNFTPSQLRNFAVDFVDWHVRREPKPQPITCAPAGKMQQHGWCLGDDCEYRQQRRREGNARRAGISAQRLARWRNHLVGQERDGYYIAAVYDAIRQRWLDMDLGEGDVVYIGLRAIDKAAASAVERLPKRRKRKRKAAVAADCKRAARGVHVLENCGLLKVVERGVPGASSRQSNGYLLLPLPRAP